MVLAITAFSGQCVAQVHGNSKHGAGVLRYMNPALDDSPLAAFINQAAIGTSYPPCNRNFFSARRAEFLRSAYDGVTDMERRQL